MMVLIDYLSFRERMRQETKPTPKPATEQPKQPWEPLLIEEWLELELQRAR